MSDPGPADPDGTRERLHAWLAERGMDPYAITEQEVRQIHRVSGGDPGRITRLAQQKFEDPALAPRPRATGTIPLPGVRERFPGRTQPPVADLL